MRSFRFHRHLLPALVLTLGPGACVPDPDVPTAEEYAAMRRQMIQAIERDVRETAAYIGKTRLDPRVMDAMERVPRHEFVPPGALSGAYDNRPLPIGQGQTISQPYIVALMSDMLAVEPGAAVLEVGTGSGYQAAVLAEMGALVYSIEILEPLGLEARERLARLGYDRVQVRIGDGYAGWPEQAPFDAVIVTAAAPHVPEPLVQQLKPGGRMAIPVGEAWFAQQLLLVTKDAAGEAHSHSVLPVAFVPLTGEH